MPSCTKFELNIECVNAAFDENTGAETARILRELADKIEFSYNGRLPDEYPVWDYNGNRVGVGRFYRGHN